MKLVIDHLTRYGYDEEVKFSTQYLRLTPRSTGRQTITAWTLTLPDGAAVTTTDGWGNVLHVLTLDNPHKGNHYPRQRDCRYRRRRGGDA